MKKKNDLIVVGVLLAGALLLHALAALLPEPGPARQTADVTPAPEAVQQTDPG